jgi:hypothetical protein
MNLIEMFKELSDEEKQEFINLLIQEINKKTTKSGNPKLIFR